MGEILDKQRKQRERLVREDGLLKVFCEVKLLGDGQERQKISSGFHHLLRVLVKEDGQLSVQDFGLVFFLIRQVCFATESQHFSPFAQPVGLQKLETESLVTKAPYNQLSNSAYK